VSDPHDLRSPYPFRRRVLCPIDSWSIEFALFCMSEHFRLDLSRNIIADGASVIRLCPQGTLAADSWCIRWCHHPATDAGTYSGTVGIPKLSTWPDKAAVSIVIEDPNFPYGVCGDETKGFTLFDDARTSMP
jgi:hypothetical protein